MSEGYQGIKFDVVLKEKKAPQHEYLSLLMKWCEIFHEKNLAPPYTGGSYGNLSFRTGEKELTFIITGTSIGLKCNLSSESFVKIEQCNLKTGEVIAFGLRKPSSETMLHWAIYEKRKDIKAIFHGHSKDILENTKKLNLVETKKEEPYGTLELVNSVVNILGNNDFIIAKNHGFFSLGSHENLEEAINIAGKKAEEILEKCRY